MYKLLVLDLDGTLTNSKKEITPHTLKTLLSAQERGLRIVLASGRPVWGIAPLAQQLRLEEFGGYVLAFNGGEIIRWEDRVPLYQNLLRPDVLPYFYSCSKRGDFSIITYDEDCILTENPENKYVQHESMLNKMPVRKVENFLQEALKRLRPKCLLVGDPEPLHELELEMKEHLKGKNEVYRSEPFFIELVPQNIDKAQSLSVLLKKLGMSNEEMICVGDGYNDLTMVKYAGLGVAMANACLELKAVANYITLSNEEDGVAHLVETLKL